MSEMTIRLIRDPQTGKRNIVISLSSDEDALPQEHEEQHRLLVDKLIEGGVLSAAEVGKIIVERDQDTGEETKQSQSQAEGEQRAQSQGS